MRLINSVISVLGTAFSTAAKHTGLRDLTSEECLKQSILFESKDLNAFARKNGVSAIKVTQKGQGIDGLDKNILRLLVSVYQSNGFPAERKLVVDFDLSSEKQVYEALIKLKSIFYLEIGKIAPHTIPTLTEIVEPS